MAINSLVSQPKPENCKNFKIDIPQDHKDQKKPHKTSSSFLNQKRGQCNQNESHQFAEPETPSSPKFSCLINSIKGYDNKIEDDLLSIQNQLETHLGFHSQ